jgi:2-deoxy-D-gluconate 3-dehydrogenase
VGRFDLNGKVAIVTGVNGGIGLGIAHGLAEYGAAVVVAGRNGAKNAAAVGELIGIGRVVSSVLVDVTSEAWCDAMVAETVSHYGRVDILVNNAGANNRKLPHETTMDEWRTVMDTNLSSVMMCSPAVYPHMKRLGGGKIINTGSMASILTASFAPAYAASKAGIIQLGRVCASSWTKDNIQVNAILLGFIATAMTEPFRQNASISDRIIARTPAGRWGTPDDLAGIAGFCGQCGVGLHHWCRGPC